MTRALVLCDGVTPPASVVSEDWDQRVELRHRGANANVNLNIQSPAHRLLSHVEDRSADLLRIASYVYAADQSVSRGGETDVYGDSWSRNFLICLPVSEPDFWSDLNITDILYDTLHFLSDDAWSFRFTKGRPEAQQLKFQVDEGEVMGRPTSLFLFSGGLDSLCAVVEAASSNEKPLLVGHSPAFHIRGRQRRLVQLLRDLLKNWRFPYLSVSIHRSDSKDPRDYSQRTRSFLYASIGSVIAHRLGLDTVNLADNGVISVNLPINDQLLGSKASRSTHPKFLNLFTRLCATIYEHAPVIANPLWTRTRAETIDVLKSSSCLDLIEATNSCSSPRNLPSLRPHCGVCSQCIDRRFATLASGLEEYDPGERYGVDIFSQDLAAGGPRTMALSYVGLAQKLAQLQAEEMFVTYPQLYDCIQPERADQREVAEALSAMLRRHGQSVVEVLKVQFERYSDKLAKRELPDTCLLRLVAAPTEYESSRTAQPPSFEHTADYRWIRVNGREFNLPELAAQVVQLLDASRLAGKPYLAWAAIAADLTGSPPKMSDVFRTVDEWHRIIRRKGRSHYALNL